MDKKPLILILLLLCIVSVFGQHPDIDQSHWQYSFTENKNQWHADVKFRTEIPNGVLFIENKGLTYLFYDQDAYRKMMEFKFHPDKYKMIQKQDQQIPCHAFKVSFVGAVENANPSPEAKLPSCKNYFIGNKPSAWASRVNSYAEINYNDLYPGINLEVSGNDHQLKYTFHLKPGVHPNAIRMEYTGADIRKRNWELIGKSPFLT